MAEGFLSWQPMEQFFGEEDRLRPPCFSVAVIENLMLAPI
jgi:hypothetical protein